MTQPQGDLDRKRAIEAAVARAETGDFSGLGPIRESLGSSNAEVRLKGAHACERIGFSQAVDPLSRMATTDPASECRNQAIYALVGIGSPAVVQALIAALDDEDLERRQDARTALYRVLGEEVVGLLADEDGGPDPDPEESARVTSWWRSQAQRFDPKKVYAFGETASPGTFIAQIRLRPSPLPDASLDTLRDWTGQDFGQTPLRKVIQKWEKWWTGNRAKYEPGQRHFYGYHVP